MLNTLKNTTAIKLLIKELTANGRFDRKEISLHCRAVVYACFLTEIEPHQLPVSNQCRGNLSPSQKKEFLDQYYSLYMDKKGCRRHTVSAMLQNEPSWSFLLRLVESVIDTRGEQTDKDNF
jgi:hypothetical protein